MTWQVVGSAALFLGRWEDAIQDLPKGFESVDVTITDPPYSDQTHKGARSLGKDGIEAPIDFDSVSKETLTSAIRQIVGLTKRWTVATIDWGHALALKEDPACGFVRLGAWVKTNAAPQFTGDRPGTGWEAVAILHRGGRKRWNGGGRCATWTFPSARGVAHPTAKPLALIREFTRLFSDPGETIFDPFMGSGTTGQAAVSLGRRFLGAEIDPTYYAIALSRLETEQRQTRLSLSD
jgi:site-specific DNA-methyltransferase (adenine-specific)